MKNYFQKNRVLVTGGAGFLGSHLCERLLERGSVVICLDNFFTGSRANVAHLMQNPDFEVIRHDVVDPIRLEVDQIYNLACPASPVHYQHDPIKTLQTSVWGGLNMLELALQNGARILQASTSEVYGDPSVHPQPESYWGHVNPRARRPTVKARTRPARAHLVRTAGGVRQGIAGHQGIPVSVSVPALPGAPGFGVVALVGVVLAPGERESQAQGHQDQAKRTHRGRPVCRARATGHEP